MYLGFQGEYGAFSEMAGRKFFNNQLVPKPAKTFEEVFQKVESGEFVYGVVPIENSTGGVVHPVIDCFGTNACSVIGEVFQDVRHCLIGNPDSHFEHIQYVLGHWQARAQCEQFLSTNPQFLVEDAYDTAGSVKLIKGKNVAAAIASEAAATLHGMKILRRDIQDRADNTTRFLVISQSLKPDEVGNKFSLICRLKHDQGSLLNLLKELDDYEVNLTSIYSRPIKDKPFEYNFFIEGIFLLEEIDTQNFIEAVQDESVTCKFLGRYKSAVIGPHPDKG